MAAGDKVQIGTAFKVEYGSFTFAGYQPSNVQSVSTGEVNTIADIRGADKTYIVSNPGKRLVLDLMIEDTADIDPIAIGTIVTVTPPNVETPLKYINLTEAPVTHTNDVSTLRVTLERRDSMGTVLDEDS